MRVDALEKFGRLLDPGLQLAGREVAVAARLIYELPGHDGRVVPAQPAQHDTTSMTIASFEIFRRRHWQQ